MTKQTQKEAVFTAITNVLNEQGITVEQGTNVSPYMTRETRAQVNAILFEAFKSGSIELDKEFSDSDLKAYVSGLQSNWIRKDKRLNGGVNYVAKNPGSRAGLGDPALKAMRALLSTLTEESDKAEVESEIQKRVSEINAGKVKKVDINYSALPAHLQSKFSK